MPAPSLEEVRREKARRHLLDFIRWASPHYLPPVHLAPLVEKLEAINRGETVQVVVSTPPRHAKTETLLHAVPWLLQGHPEWTISYTSYGADITRSKSRVALELAQRSGVELTSQNVTEWRTPEGGGCLAKAVGEGLTGHGIDVAIVDDPNKDRMSAESAVIRARNRDWFNDVLFTRRNPGNRPRSIIVNAARWHPDDLPGYLTREKGWQYINLPAISEAGQPLWPEMWGAKALEEIRTQLGDYAWASLFMGAPRPRGGSVFGDPYVYERLPAGYRVAIGLDLAYTRKTASDRSVLVVMAEADGYFYILDVLRVQLRAPEFAELAVQYRVRYPTARWRWYAAGTETGVADFMRPLLKNVPLEVLPPRGDKFVRAQPYAAAWNAQRVLLPEEPMPWVGPFVEEHVNFTGVNDATDDTIDAGAAAFDILASTRGSGQVGVRATGSRRM